MFESLLKSVEHNIYSMCGWMKSINLLIQPELFELYLYILYVYVYLYLYTTIVYVFERSLLCSPRLQFFWTKIYETSNIVKY